VLHDPGGVGLPPVLEGWVGSTLDGLDEAVKAYGHRATCQPLHLQLLQVILQGLQVISVLQHQLVGRLRVRDRSPSPILVLSADTGLSR
jgi:hypothetical protein